MQLIQTAVLYVGVASLACFGCATASSPINSSPDVQAACEAQRQTFGTPLLPESKRDEAITARFGRVCVELSRQEGLDFGENNDAYLCRVFLPRHRQPLHPYVARAMEEIEPAFGTKLDANTFPVQRLMRGDGGFIGVTTSFAILSDPAGGPVRIVYTLDELDRELRSVRSLPGALDLAALRNHTGRQSRAHPLCGAKGVDSDENAWVVREVSIFENCVGHFTRDLRIDRSGQVSVLSEEKSAGPIACID